MKRDNWLNSCLNMVNEILPTLYIELLKQNNAIVRVHPLKTSYYCIP